MTFGALIRERRAGLGRSQRWVAERARISPQFLCDLETDKAPRPSPAVLARLAEALECPYEDLAAAVVADFAARYMVVPQSGP